MITITKQDNGVLFGFEDSKKYLYGNGSILVPFNTLSIIADESNMITLRKAASNDIFLSARYDTDLGYGSKDDAIDDLKDLLFAETGGGSGSGMTPSEVQEMIDESISGMSEDVQSLELTKADTSAVTAAIDAAISGKADTSAVTAVNDALTAHTANTSVHVTSAEKTEWNAKQDALYIYTEDNNLGTAELHSNDSSIIFNAGGASITANNAMGVNTFNVASTGVTINGENVATEPYVDAALSGKADTSAVTAVANDVSTLSGAVDDAKAYYISFATLATQGISDDDWDGIVAAIDDHRPIYAGYPRQDGGIIYYGVECMNKNVSNTEIVMTASDNSAHYFYTFTKNGSNDYSYTVSTKPYVPDITTSITSGSTDSEIPTAKAVYDAIPTGGGATYSAGTNISIDTANTINCTLNLRNGTGDNSLVGTDNSNTATKNSTFCFGQNLTSSRMFGVSFGLKNVFSESGSQNIFGQSGNTLFSIGNGNRNGGQYHNALDIRQNGDIYFPDTDNTTYQNHYEKPMVRLQDMYAALGGLKLVSLSQSEYDNLATKSNDTLYIINNVVS